MKNILFLLFFAISTSFVNGQVPRSNAFHAKYKLKRVVVFSRHNVRSPMCGPESFLGRVTPHPWREWGTGTSELTQRGGVLETINGQFFRMWLEKENLLKHNENSFGNDVKFFSNSNQRTIATAKYFSTGLLPTANINVNYDYAVGGQDPMFMLELHGVDDKFRKEAYKELDEHFGKNGLSAFSKKFQKSYNLLAKTIDFTQSPAYKNGEITSTNDHNIHITYTEGKQPQVSGTLGWMGEVADAMILQYYEEPDAQRAAFGHELTRDEWCELGKIKAAYDEVRFAIPLINRTMAAPIVAAVKRELENKNRRFSFICGHDLNLTTMMNALRVKPYQPQNAIEAHTPVASKMVFEVWTDAQGNEFIAVNHVYMTVNQMRSISLLTLNNPPMIIPLQFETLTPNADGLYPAKEFMRL